MIHTIKCEAANVADGCLLETGLYVFDIGDALDSVPLKVFKQEPVELVVDYECELEAAEPCFNIVYTEDKLKKTKKWKDGYLRFAKESSTVCIIRIIVG